MYLQHPLGLDILKPVPCLLFVWSTVDKLWNSNRSIHGYRAIYMPGCFTDKDLSYVSSMHSFHFKCVPSPLNSVQGTFLATRDDCWKWRIVNSNPLINPTVLTPHSFRSDTMLIFGVWSGTEAGLESEICVKACPQTRGPKMLCRTL